MTMKELVSAKRTAFNQFLAIAISRVVFLGPLERLKIILQTKHMPKYANPRSDLPKGVVDLGGSKLLFHF